MRIKARIRVEIGATVWEKEADVEYDNESDEFVAYSDPNHVSKSQILLVEARLKSLLETLKPAEAK